jgi:hypothetical protein
MKKTILILSVFAFIASSCGNKTEKIVINEREIEYPAEEFEENQTRKRVKYYFKGSNETVVFFDDGTAYESSDGDVGISRDGYVVLDESLTERTWEGAPYREFPDFVIIGKIERFDFFGDFGRITPDWQIINYHLISSRRMQITNFETDIENISKSNIQHITENCLILIRPEFGNSSEEDGDPAADWDYYAHETSKRYKAMGIETVSAKKQYLRFTIADDEKIVIDTKKEQNGTLPPSALLHRRGYIPIMISISGESDEGNEMIEEYLRESGDGIISTHKITDKDVRKHCENFINCIKSGELKQSLAYFAPKYVKEEHDGFLAGRTDQFLSEFLAGYSLTGGDFIVPKNVSDIESIKIKKARVNPNAVEANVIFEIKLVTGVKYSVDVYLSIDNNRLYFWGAVG